MTIMQWLTGPNGQLFSSSSVIVILILMLFMSIKLYVSFRNKQIYRWLITAITLIIARQGLLVVLAYPGWSLSSWLYLASHMLQTISFIIINFVFMKLYTYRSAQLRIMPFVLMILMTVILAGAQIALTPFSTSNMVFEPVAFPLLDLYSLVVILIILIASKNAELSTKYYSSLIVFFVYSLLQIANLYIFENEQPFIGLLIQILPIVYFTLLFILLFEWVIERLMSTYQSSIIDGLTGLYNRSHFQNKAEQMLVRHKSVAMIFCDIDNFKQLNDTQGHHNADIVLKKVAEIIKEESNSIGYAGRYGGEELLACIATNRVEPELVAESIRRRVHSETSVTISIGICTTNASTTVADLIRFADEAMYRSKSNGKNQVTSYLPTPRTRKKQVRA